MRLSILDRGHDIRTKALFLIMRLVSRHQVVDAVKLAFYRPDFAGTGRLTQEAMRGQSDWSVADRELMAAFISKVNNTEFCLIAHSATAGMAYKDDAKVTATLADLDTAPIEEVSQWTIPPRLEPARSTCCRVATAKCAATQSAC